MFSASCRVLGRRARLATVAVTGSLAMCVTTYNAPSHPGSSYDTLRQHVAVGSREIASYTMLHDKLFVLDNLVTRGLLTILRDVNTDHPTFVTTSNRLTTILMEYGFALLPGAKEQIIETPCGPCTGLRLVPHKDVTVVSILRSGDALLDAARSVAPSASVGKVLIQRNESSDAKEPHLYYVKFPRDIAKHKVILVDPMLATGGSALMAIGELLRCGVQEENVVFVNVVSCPEGISAIACKYPAITILTAAVDDHLNAHKYIVPGLGDFGDRYFNTTG